MTEERSYINVKESHLFQLFEDILNNPLCIAVTGALWVVFGFKVFASEREGGEAND